MNRSKTICLNMIAKDEAHIIRDTLTKLLQKIKIDFWVICDTGSTDATKEIIQSFFDEQGISGELYDCEWRNFADNRSLALEYAFGKTDYVFVWDADDEIVGNLQLPTLEADWYSFQFSDDSGTLYKRPQLFKNTIKWMYKSVLHEYVMSQEPLRPQIHIFGEYHFLSGRTSNRNKDTNKYLKDALILDAAYHKAIEEKDDLHMRYAYYGAKSYFDAGALEKALEFYKKVLGHDGWSEEKYNSCISIYSIYKVMLQPDEGIGYLLKARAYNPRRAEWIFYLVQHYIEKDTALAYAYYTLFQNYYEKEYKSSDMQSWLFVNRSIQEFQLAYYMIIVCERTKNYQTGANLCALICRFKSPFVTEFFLNNWIYNMQFFKPYLAASADFVKHLRHYVQILGDKGVLVVGKQVQILQDLYALKTADQSS